MDGLEEEFKVKGIQLIEIVNSLIEMAITFQTTIKGLAGGGQVGT